METAMQYKVRGETLVRANYKTGSTVSLTNDKIILNDFPQLRAAATNGSSRLTTFYYKKKTKSTSRTSWWGTGVILTVDDRQVCRGKRRVNEGSRRIRTTLQRVESKHHPETRQDHVGLEHSTRMRKASFSTIGLRLISSWDISAHSWAICRKTKVLQLHSDKGLLIRKRVVVKHMIQCAQWS